MDFLVSPIYTETHKFRCYRHCIRIHMHNFTLSWNILPIPSICILWCIYFYQLNLYTYRNKCIKRQSSGSFVYVHDVDKCQNIFQTSYVHCYNLFSLGLSVWMKNVFELPHKKHERTGECKFNFLSAFCPCVSVVSDAIVPDQRESICFQGYTQNAPNKMIWHQFQKSNIFSHKVTRFFSSFIFVHFFSFANKAYDLLSFYFVDWWNGILPLIETCFFPLVLFVMYILAGIYVIWFVFDWFNSISFVFSYSFGKTSKKHLSDTKKLCIKLILWTDKLKVKSIMAHRIDYIRCLICFDDGPKKRESKEQHYLIAAINWHSLNKHRSLTNY